MLRWRYATDRVWSSIHSEQTKVFFRCRVVRVKLGLGVLFIAMAIMIVVNLRW